MKFLLVALALSLTACSVVGPGEKGLRVSLGKVSDESLASGAYLWIPFFYGTKTINVQIQKSETETSAASKDMQEIQTKIAINWSIDPDKVVSLYRTIGDEDDVYNRIISPAVSEVMKSATAKRTAEEVLIARMDLKKDIDEGLKERLANYGVRLTDVSIVNLTFSHEFTQAIEQKQIAEQNAKKASYVAVMATEEAKASVNRARGEAEAQKLMQTTITKEILQLKAVEKWNGQFPQVMGSGTLPFINVTPKQ